MNTEEIWRKTTFLNGLNSNQKEDLSILLLQRLWKNKWHSKFLIKKALYSIQVKTKKVLL